MYNILVVDDDKEIVDSIEIYLKSEGFKIYKAYDGMKALEIITENDIHLILMDIMMPKLDGIKATVKIREERNIPIILISAKSEDNKIHSMDYFSANDGPVITKSGALELNTLTKEVKIDGENIKMTPIEYKIIELLLENKGRVFSIDEIYEKVWNEESFNSENTVAVHIRRIREKIEINPKEPRFLKVVWGVGYKIEKF